MEKECFPQFIEQNILQYLGYTYIHIVWYCVTWLMKPCSDIDCNVVPPNFNGCFKELLNTSDFQTQYTNLNIESTKNKNLSVKSTHS